MNELTLKKRVSDKFETPDGRIVDVLYATSDGELHFSPDDAKRATEKLDDKSVVPHYRDQSVRELGKQYMELNKMILLTDYLKLMRLQRKAPTYAEYLQVCVERSMGPVSENIYKFVESKVFSSRKLVAPGQKDTIFMFNRGIVEAYFLRSYPQGKIWMYGDTLVMTCPTHTELGEITYYDIFGNILGEDPKKKT